MVSTKNGIMFNFFFNYFKLRFILKIFEVNRTEQLRIVKKTIILKQGILM